MKIGDKLKAYSHDKWIKIDKAFIGKIGIVESIGSDGDLRVIFKDPYPDYWWFPGDDPRSKKYIPLKNKLK